MFKILEKNLKPFIINLILTAAVVTVLKFLTGPGVSVVLVIIGGPLILFAVVGAIFINEQYEEKQGAYELLGMLPVRPSEIIGAKFIPVVGTAFLLTGYLMMILGGGAAGPDERRLIQAFILLAGCGVVVLSGIIYLGIYLLGYTKFSIVVLTFTTALGLVPMFIMKSYRGRMNILENRILDGLRSLEPFTAIAFSLTVCFVFYLLAVQIKARRLAP